VQLLWGLYETSAEARRLDRTMAFAAKTPSLVGHQRWRLSYASGPSETEGGSSARSRTLSIYPPESHPAMSRKGCFPAKSAMQRAPCSSLHSLCPRRLKRTVLGQQTVRPPQHRLVAVNPPSRSHATQNARPPPRPLRQRALNHRQGQLALAQIHQRAVVQRSTQRRRNPAGHSKRNVA